MTSRGRGRRRARRVLLAASAATFVLGLAVPGARAQDTGDEPADLPDVFSGATSASAMDVDLVTPALVPVEGLFDFSVAQGSSSYERTNQSGRASVVFPGQGLIQGPDLLCGTFIGPQIPPDGQPIFGPLLTACQQYNFPLSVAVDSLEPDKSTEGDTQLGTPADPLSMHGLGARAHAGLDATTTDAEASDMHLTGLPALGSLGPLLDLLGMAQPDSSLISADGMSARTDQRIVDGALVSHAEATVSGLHLLGGLVQIGSIVSSSTVTSATGADPVKAASLEVSGVTVAGQPAQITEDGLVLGTADPSGGPLLQQLVSQVAAVLQGAGMKFTLLPSSEDDVNGTPAASVGGLLIEFTAPLTGLPAIPGPAGDIDLNGSYGVRMLVGTTGVRAVANTFEPPGPPTPVSGALAGGSTPIAGGSSSPVLGGGSSSPVGSTPAPTAPATTPATQAPQPAGFFDDVFADRLGFVYLSFTLAAIALCLAPRLSLPARLPAVRSD